jgi:drug/metabolite transporter (DMT)-like permease
MSLHIFLLVIAASLFQAWWNFHLKKVTIDKAAFLLVGWLFFGLVTTPISLFFLDKPFELRWLMFVIATGFAQGIYLVVLSWAYTVADISVVFPIARGIGIGYTSLILALIGGYTMTTFGITGIVAVISGALCLGSVEFKNKGNRTGIGLALVLAFIVTSYSVIDSFGAREIPVLFYVVSMNITAPLFAFPFLYATKKKDIRLAWNKYRWQGFLVAAAGSFGYVIVVWAFRWSPAPYVLALREISIVFASIMAVYYLKEKIYLRKVIGIALILLGIFFIKMA